MYFFIIKKKLGSIIKKKDILGVISDGIYEYENADGRQFGHQGVAKVIDDGGFHSMQELVEAIMQAARRHGGAVPQADDITIVLLQRTG